MVWHLDQVSFATQKTVKLNKNKIQTEQTVAQDWNQTGGRVQTAHREADEEEGRRS